MHKTLLILGLLQNGPLHGYDLHRIVQAHGDIYADLKKPNLYYLLDRMAAEGLLHVHAETGARGARGERLIYELTEQGQTRFQELLREVLRSYEPVHTGIEVAITFLKRLSLEDAVSLLEERRSAVVIYQEQLLVHQQNNETNPLTAIALDHLAGLVVAELQWVDRSLVRLRDQHSADEQLAPPKHG